MSQDQKLTSFTLKLTVSDQPGVLVRVIQVFTRRSYNIESVKVKNIDHDNNLSEIIIQAVGQSESVNSVISQLSKIINVRSVSRL